MLRSAAALLCLATTSACLAQAPAPPAGTLQQQIEAITQEPAVARAHWGVSVTTLSGQPIAALNDGQFFQPASNTKLFTTATAMALLPMNARIHTRVLAFGKSLRDGTLDGDLRLEGAGDANFSGRPVPYQPPQAGEASSARNELRYIDELADKIQADGLHRVAGNIVGDDSAFDYQPFPPDWSLDDLTWYYGAPINALMIADNSLTITVTPGARLSGTGETTEYAPPVVTVDPDLPWYTIDAHDLGTYPSNQVTRTHIQISRDPGSRILHLRGVITPDSSPYVQAISLDDPAEYAALALKRALERRGIVVNGRAIARHGSPAHPEDLEQESYADAHPPRYGEPLKPAVTLRERFRPPPSLQSCVEASPLPDLLICQMAEHLSPPLYDDIVVTNKVSQNQHAEVLLRLLGGGTTAGGATIVRRFLTEQAGIDPRDFYFNDGSGMSGHNIVTPRAITQLLRYASTQPWGAQWKASLPVGGVDGSLRSRFPNEPLKNHVFAKTGTLGEVHALSGYLDCRSGQTVVFSVMVTTHTPLNNDDLKAMDRIVAAIAAAV